MNTTHTHIWCPTCQAVRPLRMADLQSGHDTRRFTSASDLLCDAGFVVATLYSVKPGIETLQRKA
jgi:hypothetical protein